MVDDISGFYVYSNQAATDMKGFLVNQNDVDQPDYLDAPTIQTLKYYPEVTRPDTDFVEYVTSYSDDMEDINQG